MPPFLLTSARTQRVKRGFRLPHFVLIGVGIFSLLFVLSVVSFALSTTAAVGGTVRAYREMDEKLPNAGSVAARSFRTTTLLDRNGVLLQQVDQKEGGWRTFVPLDQVSPYLIQATIAAEDATFWTHYGVEPFAIARGAVINLSGTGSSGGSTITQQLARGLYPEDIGNDYTIQRKIKEAFGAVIIEKDFSKQDILTMYLNLIFYGQRSYGIEAAAQTYFGKAAKDLDLAESSLLAGLPQAPSYYDPIYNFDQAKKRQRYVLDQMVKYGYISQETADKAFDQRLRPQQRDGTIRPGAEHFTIWVRQYLEQRWPGLLYKGGVKITTSIDVELQERAQSIVTDEVVTNLVANGRNNAAMVVMVPWSGQILAMVGSAGFDDPFIGGQVNYAIEKRQPGSSIKPLVYAAAFEKGWNPGTIVMDTAYREEIVGSSDPVWEPNNYSGMFYGAVSVRTALANSLNIPAIKAIRYAGVPHTIDLARRMGLVTSLDRPWYDYGHSLALGSGEVSLLEHTNAFATLANNGTFVAYNPILKIEDSQGNVLYDVKKEKPWESAPQALKAEYAYQITSILTDNDARSMIFSPNNLFGDTQKQLGRPTAAKSGTTDQWKDIWTMGYTSDLAVGVWVGNTSADGTSPPALSQLDGIQGAGPIWKRMMVEMHENSRWAKLIDGPNGNPMPESFKRPDGIYDGEICAATGHQATPGFESKKEVLVRNEGPFLPCNQLSAYEASELKAALDDIRQNGKYTNGGVGKIERYASVAQGGQDIRSNPSDNASPNQLPNSDTGNNQYAPSDTADEIYLPADEEQPIVPIE
jgi:membrane peptidoglycan carboxypeptidase